MILIAVCMMAATTVWGQVPSANVVTLQDAINTALANNKAIRLARDRYERSRAQTREARSVGLPHLGAQAQRQWMGPVAEFTIGPPEDPQTIRIGTPVITTAAVTLSQILDLNRRISLATGIADLNSHIQNLGVARTEQQIIFAVQDAYYGVLRAEGQRDVAKAAVTTARERLRLARANFEAGASPKFDVTRAEVEAANLEQTLTSATAAVDVRKTALRNVMGTDPTIPLEATPVEVPIQPLETTVEQSYATALARRPDIAAAETGTLLARKSVTLVKRERLPAFGALASYNYVVETSVFQPNQLSWTVAVNASLPIFEGGAIRARVDQARSDVEAAEDGLAQTKLDVGQDVKSSIISVNEAYQRALTAEKNVALAEEALRLAQVRFEAGISLQVEVIDAEAALTQAGTNLVNARYDYATALAGYRRATATQPEFEKAVVPPTKTENK